MTIDSGFPIGYFYIISNLNGMVIDVEDPENAHVCTKCQLWLLLLLSNDHYSMIGWLQDCDGSQKRGITRA